MGDADRASVGDEVAYSFDVSNNGTATMSSIKISDNMVRTCRSRLCRSVDDRDLPERGYPQPGAFIFKSQNTSCVRGFF